MLLTVKNVHEESSAKMTLQCVLVIIFFELPEVYVAVKTNKINMKFFKKKKKKNTRNGKLNKCIYLFPSKLTERNSHQGE